MIHHLQHDDRERGERTAQRQRLQGNMGSKKSGCDIYTWGRETKSI